MAIQKTISLEYKGETIVSQPFKFRQACLVDDERYRGGGLATGARTALISMFDGTKITEEIVENGEIDIKTLRKAVDRVIDMFLGIDEEVKNS